MLLFAVKTDYYLENVSTYKNEDMKKIVDGQQRIIKKAKKVFNIMKSSE